MLKRAALLLALPLLLSAASWDGAKGPLTVVTFTSPGSAGVAAMGLPSVPGIPELTVISIRCSDPKVTAARVTIVYRHETGERKATYLAEFVNGGGGVVVSIPSVDILPDQVKFTELRDGETY